MRSFAPKPHRSAAPIDCDLLFEGGIVFDGTGAPAQNVAVAVRDQRICGIGEAQAFRPEATRRIDGLALAPGFIDAHTHDDYALLVSPDLLFKTSQGVTTVVIGNCGVSLAPHLAGEATPPSPMTEIGPNEAFRFADFEAYFAALRETGMAVNAAALVGHLTLRAATMDSYDRPATAKERAAMRAHCESAMKAGCFGVSSGLFYPLAYPAPAEEVAELVTIAGAYGGVYASHLRDEADHISEAIDEALGIAKKGNARLIISHHKLAGPQNFGRSTETLRQIAKAGSSHPVGFDVYPYTASSTMLTAKSWAISTRTKITWSDPHPEFAGWDLPDVAKALRVTEEEALDKLSPGGGVYFQMDESDVQRIMSCPAAMIGSDGVPLKDTPHPRLYGTFPRVLGHYARDVGLFSVQAAVRKMTSLPAAQFGLTDRGVIAEGAWADLVVFDPETVSDEATFDKPTKLSSGIIATYTNGEAVFEAGGDTGARPGQILKRGVH